MRNVHFVLLLMIFFSPLLLSAQSGGKKVKVSGTVIEKTSGQPLEYATVTFFTPNTTTPVAGGITDSQGKFEIDVTTGTYNISIEFISFAVTELKQRSILEN